MQGKAMGLKVNEGALLGQREVAKIMGISRGRVHQLEKGALLKIKRTIEREAKEAGMTVAEWLGEE